MKPKHITISLLISLAIACFPSPATAEDIQLIAVDYQTSWVDEGMRAIVLPDHSALVSQSSPEFFVRRVKLSTAEIQSLQGIFTKHGFVNLPAQIVTNVTDGNDTDLSYCSGGSCHVVHEYMGTGPAAEAVHTIYQQVKTIFHSKLAAAQALTPREALEALHTAIGGNKDINESAALFTRHLARGTRPPFPDDQFICRDAASNKVSVRDQPGDGCRPQVVWPSARWLNKRGDSSVRSKNGYVCRSGPMTFFTTEPLDKITGSTRQQQRCSEKTIECDGEVRFLTSKQCIRQNIKSLAQMNDVTDSVLQNKPCAPGTEAFIDSWEYEEQCAGEESCFFRDKAYALEVFSQFEQLKSLPQGDDHRPFSRQSLLATAETDQALSEPGLYCTKVSSVGEKPTMTAATLLSAAAYFPPAPVPPSGGVRPPNGCREDSECVHIGSSCALRSFAEKIAQSSGQKIVNSGCRCAKGPVVYGCVPASPM